MSLSEAEFTKIVEAPCPKCASEDLLLRAYVKARFTLLDGEAYGAPALGYKGEDLAKGTFRAECASCKHRVYESDACPACGKDGVARAIETPDAHGPTRPKACPQCSDEQVGYVAWLPVVVKSHATRPEKPRPLSSLDDDGCHGIRVECKQCLYNEPLPSTGCALCGS